MINAMRFSFWIILAFLMVISPCKAADLMTVGELYAKCTSRNYNGIDHTFCAGYALGSVYNAPAQVCMNGNVMAGAVVQVFINWAQFHPERWADSAGSGMENAMISAWPCR